MLIRVLGDAATVDALRLAGIEGRALRDDEEAADVFEQMLKTEDLGVLLVAEPVAAGIRARVDASKLARRLPLVLEIPARGSDMVSADDLVSRVARMVGLRA